MEVDVLRVYGRFETGTVELNAIEVEEEYA